MGDDARLVAVCRALDYEFRRPELLLSALTHPSTLNHKTQPAAYERLEFLGDRVLGLAVAEMLYHRFPQENEGALARRHAALVCRESLVRVSGALGLAQALVLGRSEEDGGGRSNSGTLADVCEAVLGAVYADGGFAAAATIIQRHWDDLIAEAVSPPKDAKTALQEWAQGRGKPLPRYETSAVEGPPHDPIFLVTVTVEGFTPLTGRGSSKRVAERLAAEGVVETDRVVNEEFGTMELGMTETGQRCGFVAIIGAPNVGKSTLVNCLVGAKVTIVSPKVQTTRNRVMGVALVPDLAAQVIFVDTPGIFAPKRRLERAMVHAAWTGMKEADAMALVVDATRGLDEPTSAIIDKLVADGRRGALVINKIDLVQRDKLLGLTAKLSEFGIFEPVFMISAKKGDGTADLLNHFAKLVPVGPWHFPEDQLSDVPMRLLAAEITREQIFHRLHEELPYAILVETDIWTENDDGSVRIDQTIYVQRDSQKSIVLGKGGRQIKDIGSKAREEMISILERPVHLFLHVKVRENWLEERHRYRDMGLDFDV